MFYDFLFSSSWVFSMVWGIIWEIPFWFFWLSLACLFLVSGFYPRSCLHLPLVALLSGYQFYASTSSYCASVSCDGVICG